MSKSADAFRTISEVAEWLDTPAHVLRFWESKFTQVKPVKRAGGRRYYRPADMRLLGGIKKLLHDDGMTIKGVQKILREQGIKHVSSLCALDMSEEDEADLIMLEEVPASEPVDTVIPFAKPEVEEFAELPVADEPLAEPPALEDASDETPDHSETAEPVSHGDVAEEVSETPDLEEPEPDQDAVEAAPETPPEMEGDQHEEGEPEDTTEANALPAFLQHSMDDRRSEVVEAEAEVTTPPEPVAPPASIDPVPGALTHLSRITRLSAESARQIAPLAEKLKARAG